MATPTKIAAARASERFIKALIDLAARGLRTHCSEPEIHHLWLSEVDAERDVEGGPFEVGLVVIDNKGEAIKAHR